MRPEELLRQELPLIERVIASVCKRNCCYGDEAEDFEQTVKLKLIENDYAILAKFQGKSSLSTYLATVIHNLFRDYRIAKWGKWRPSAKARRLGTVAVQMEVLVSRDGFSREEAIEILKKNHKVDSTRLELGRLAEQLPARTMRRFQGEETLEQVGEPGSVEQRLEDSEKAERLSRTEAALAGALERIDVEDRLLLRLRFQEGFSVAQIARRLGLEQRPLYSRYEKCLRALRGAMEQNGVSAEDVREIVAWDLFDTTIDYGVEGGGLGKRPEASV